MSKSRAELHWDYLRFLERDLIAISEVVELCEGNFSSYGPKILQLILSTGGELDAALKSYRAAVDSSVTEGSDGKANMRNHKQLLCDSFKEGFATARVKILHSSVVLEPWSPLAEGEDAKLPWWTEYNNVKHDRSQNYSNATLETALNLLAALFVVDAYLLEATLNYQLGFTQVLDWESHKPLPQLTAALSSATKGGIDVL